MPYLSRGNSYNKKYFDHYLHIGIKHSDRWWHIRVQLKTVKKTLDERKDIDEQIFARVFSCLVKCQWGDN